MFKKFDPDYSIAGLKCYRGALEGTELSSGEINISNRQLCHIELQNELVSDYISVEIQINQYGEWLPLSLIENNEIQLQKKDLYTFKLEGVVSLRLVRVGTADGDINVNVTFLD